MQLYHSQHNPEVITAKQTAKEDKLMATMVALAPGARVKVRVSSGVVRLHLPLPYFSRLD